MTTPTPAPPPTLTTIRDILPPEIYATTYRMELNRIPTQDFYRFSVTDTGDDYWDRRALQGTIFVVRSFDLSVTFARRFLDGKYRTHVADAHRRAGQPAGLYVVARRSPNVFMVRPKGTVRRRKKT